MAPATRSATATAPAPARVTRSQSSTSILGKRGAVSLSRSSSISSVKSSMSILTPDSTPNPKRIRTTTLDVDDGSNKENIPPAPESLVEAPVSTRLSRRATMDSLSIPRRIPRTPRRLSSATSIPETPTSTLAQLSLSFTTPPPTPHAPISFDAQIRALLRSISNSNTLMSMSGREKEREVIESFLRRRDQDSDDTEKILYISGSPGTGKTALVNNILSSSMFEEDIKVISINCMNCASADALWERLAEELFDLNEKKTKGKKVPAKDTVISLLQEYKNKCVIILDEFDHFINSSTALQALFGLAVSKANTIRLIGIANTHTVTSSSLLPPVFNSFSAAVVKTIHFSPYTPPQLLAIVQTRLDSLPAEAMKKVLPVPALTLLTKKVAALTGDVRVLFEVLRNAIDLANAAAKSSDAAPEETPCDAASFGVTPSHILAALKSYTPSSTSSSNAKASSQKSSSANSETISKIRNLGLQARLVLLSLLLISKRLWSGLPLPSSSSTFSVTTSPNKRASVKRTASTTSAEIGSGNAQGIDATQLHSYYCNLLQNADTFTPVTRSEFTDILGVLETTGLITVASASSKSTNGGGARSIKRSTSFAGKMKNAAGGKSSSIQEVSLVGDIRENELCRGLGVTQNTSAGTITSGDQSQEDVTADVLEEGVRSIWDKERIKITKELKAKSKELSHQELASFDDAMED